MAKTARIVGANLLESFQELLLLAAELLRRLHLHGEEEVPASAPAEVRHALGLQPHDAARLGAGVELDALRSVERLHLEVGAERRSRHRNVEDREQILSAPVEDVVGPDAERDVEIAGRSSAPAGV